MITVTSKKIKFFSFLVFLLSITHFYGEGTPTLSQNSANITAVLVAPDLRSGSFYNPGSPAGDDNRIYFRIQNNATENLYFGFDMRNFQVGLAPRLSNVYYRIINPSEY